MNGLELARPWVLWGLWLGVPIVLFHLYARRRRRVIVPFVGLLAEAVGPARPRARFRHLREASSLLLRLAALACLVLALGGLRVAKAKTPPQDLMLVVDADVTTAAREDSLAPRLAEGLEIAAAHARRHAALHPAGRVGVVLAGAPLVVLSPLDRDVDAVVRELDRVQAQVRGRPRAPGEPWVPVPASTTTDLDAAVRAASGTLLGDRPGHVLVVSARETSVVRALNDASGPVTAEVVGAGRSRADQGFDDLAIAPSPAGGYTVRAHLQSEAAKPITRRVVATLGDETVFREAVTVLPDKGGEVLFAATPKGRAGAWLSIRLEGSDALAVNDKAEAWLSPRRQPSVLLVQGAKSRGFSTLVMEALTDTVDLKRSGRVRVDQLADATLRDVMIVDGVALPEGTLKPGAWIFLAPFSGALPFRAGKPLSKPLVWRTETHHPLVRWLDFTAAEIAQGQPITGPGVEALAFADTHVVIAEGERDGVRYIAFGLDPAASYLPVQAALPLFLRRAMQRLARAPTAPLAPFYRAGMPLRSRVPLPGGSSVALVRETPLVEGRTNPWPPGPVRVDPAGAVFRVPAGAGGAYRLETRTAEGQPALVGRTAFVDFDPRRKITPVRSPGPKVRVPAARGGTTDRWRMWLLLAAALLLALDLLLLPRRRSGARSRA